MFRFIKVNLKWIVKFKCQIKVEYCKKMLKQCQNDVIRSKMGTFRLKIVLNKVCFIAGTIQELWFGYQIRRQTDNYKKLFNNFPKLNFIFLAHFLLSSLPWPSHSWALITTAVSTSLIRWELVLTCLQCLPGQFLQVKLLITLSLSER